jgi:NAD(P)-dependent dehydrogenase (short-subunit alcohol dehydrogenase family)
MNLQGQAALVTGGASGFGVQTVRVAENLSLNGEVIRLDGAVRLPPR